MSMQCTQKYFPFSSEVLNCSTQFKYVNWNAVHMKHTMLLLPSTGELRYCIWGSAKLSTPSVFGFLPFPLTTTLLCIFVVVTFVS